MGADAAPPLRQRFAGTAVATRYELTLPDLGMEQGPITVGLWLVEPGTWVAEGDPVLEILAGPAVIDLPSPGDGLLIERLADEEEPIEVGQLLAVIEAEDE